LAWPWAQEAESLETLLERADAALYAAKRMGRNRVEVASAR
jgi:PleD family two-component response regulator